MTESFPQKRIYCNLCGQERVHTCLKEHTRHLEEWEEQYRFYVCQTCHAGLLEIFDTPPQHSRVYPPEYMQALKKGIYTYYPRRCLREPKLFPRLPRELLDFYEEIIETYNWTLLRMCMLGLRALLEAICADTKIVAPHLTERLTVLQTRYSLDLTPLIEACSLFQTVATPAFHDPTQHYVEGLIESCEHLLAVIYDTVS